MDGFDSPSSVWTAAIDDPERLAATLRDAEVEYLRLGPERFTATFTSVDLGPVRIQTAADNAHISRGHVAADRTMVLIGLDLAQDGGTRVNGMEIAPRDVLHLGPGAPLFAHVPQPIEWAAVSFRNDALQQAAPGDRQVCAEEFLRFGDSRPHAALAAFLRRAGIIASRDPARLGVSAVRKAMAEEALRLCHPLLWRHPALDASQRAVHRRVALVRQAEALLASRIGAPLYSDDLQRALGVPMRSIHNAFVAVHGMSVHRYLRLRRLHRARSMLRGGPAGASHVKVAALDNGFWHLGRFAQEYQALFGELPSMTAAGAQSALLTGG